MTEYRQLLLQLFDGGKFDIDAAEGIEATYVQINNGNINIKAELNTIETYRFSVLIFNGRSEITGKINVRRAILSAIERKNGIPENGEKALGIKENLEKNLGLKIKIIWKYNKKYPNFR